jgi:hypothetical protein
LKPFYVWPDVPSKHWHGYTFQIERLPQLTDDLRVLHAEHWKETEGYRRGIPLNADYEAFAYHDQMGLYRVFTIRKGSALVGNCAMYLSKSTHTQQFVAREDTLFITESERKGWLAYSFMRYIESVLIGYGITEIDCTVKLAVNSKLLLQRLGYKHTAEQMTKIFIENVR